MSEGEDERRRLIDAFTRLAAERGYVGLRPEEVAAEARLPTDAFHRHFPDMLSCLLASHDAFLEGLYSHVEEACRHELEWTGKVRLAVATALECLVEMGSRSRLFAVEAVAAGPAMLDRRFAAIARLAAALRAGRRHHRDAAALPRSTEWILVGGALTLISAQLLAEEVSLLPMLEAELVELLLAPYVGVVEARRLAREGDGRPAASP